MVLFYISHPKVINRSQTVSILATFWMKMKILLKMKVKILFGEKKKNLKSRSSCWVVFLWAVRNILSTSLLFGGPVANFFTLLFSCTKKCLSNQTKKNCILARNFFYFHCRFFLRNVKRKRSGSYFSSSGVHSLTRDETFGAFGTLYMRSLSGAHLLNLDYWAPPMDGFDSLSRAGIMELGTRTLRGVSQVTRAPKPVGFCWWAGLNYLLQWMIRFNTRNKCKHLGIACDK